MNTTTNTTTESRTVSLLDAYPHATMTNVDLTKVRTVPSINKVLKAEYPLVVLVITRDWDQSTVAKMGRVLPSGEIVESIPGRFPFGTVRELIAAELRGMEQDRDNRKRYARLNGESDESVRAFQAQSRKTAKKLEAALLAWEAA